MRRCHSSPPARSIRRWWLAAALGSVAIITAGCAPPAPPSDPGPLLPPGCHDSSLPGVPDLEYEDHELPGVGIGWGYESESGWSQDGSCTGDPYMIAVLVRTGDRTSAVAACGRLGFYSPDPARLVDQGYEASPVVWNCMNYPWTPNDPSGAAAPR